MVLTASSTTRCRSTPADGSRHRVRRRGRRRRVRTHRAFLINVLDRPSRPRSRQQRCRCDDSGVERSTLALACVACWRCAASPSSDRKYGSGVLCSRARSHGGAPAAGQAVGRCDRSAGGSPRSVQGRGMAADGRQCRDGRGGDLGLVVPSGWPSDNRSRASPHGSKGQGICWPATARRWPSSSDPVQTGWCWWCWARWWQWSWSTACGEPAWPRGAPPAAHRRCPGGRLQGRHHAPRLGSSPCVLRVHQRRADRHAALVAKRRLTVLALAVSCAVLVAPGSGSRTLRPWPPAGPTLGGRDEPREGCRGSSQQGGSSTSSPTRCSRRSAVTPWPLTPGTQPSPTTTTSTGSRGW